MAKLIELTQVGMGPITINADLIIFCQAVGGSTSVALLGDKSFSVQEPPIVIRELVKDD